MKLTDHQQKMLDGAFGKGKAMAMQIQIGVGKCFDCLLYTSDAADEL